MKRGIAALVLCLSLVSRAEEPEPPPFVVITGQLVVVGEKPAPRDAQMMLSPTRAETALEVKPSGAFELKAFSSRTYDVRVWARGFGGVQRTVTCDAAGHADLGKVTLFPLKKVKLSLVVGHAATLAKAPVQHAELRSNGCVSVRAADDSGCSMRLCANQEEDGFLRAYGEVEVQTAGKAGLSAALKAVPRGLTIVSPPPTGPGDALEQGRTFFVRLADPYCGGALHVDTESVDLP